MNFFKRLHGLLEFLGELGVLLVLPAVAQRRKPRLQRRHAVLEVGVEFFQLLGETPDLFRIHDCLGHNKSFVFILGPARSEHQCQFRLGPDLGLGAATGRRVEGGLPAGC